MAQTQILMTLSKIEFVSRTNMWVIKCILWTGTVVRKVLWALTSVSKVSK